jgi:diguanylate cyclase (GGDEF)-like protein
MKSSISARDKRQKAQYKSIFLGIGLALVVSVMSEYVLPVLFHINMKLSLMYYAFLVFVVFIFYAIMKHRLLYIQSDYIYKRLFLNSVDGIIIVNRNSRIININNMARQILRDENLSSGELLTDYIREYCFDTDYLQQEIRINKGDQEYYLTLTQYPIDTEDKGSEKLIVITDISAAKLHHKQETDLLLEKSTIDKLTGVYNKQYFVDKYCVNQEQLRKMSLLFIDVDNFKNINDQYGHLTGDKVLAALADCLKKTVRKCNEIIRFGGDEFIILLENTEIRQAFAVAQRIRNEVNNKCISVDDQNLNITLSIGLIEGMGQIDDMLMKADMAMYQSKGKGKNTISIFTENDNDNDTPYRMKL